ncbi:oxygen-independent coproporphyrinogen III oxidase [Agaribacterium haliotis]|uniref:oxygen-independent coproporphyrinogen III oxidase n=1 Tax=Agaribacterium haliotis TaxID=2013869 RepID=UPI000BB54FB2|nr:oxygen-independent coproporphyrinogen III oxidase [Agaribacterium haliotis]
MALTFETQGDQFWDLELIRKYDLTGPRYTSYPTAPQFDGNYSEQDWQQASDSVLNRSQRISLYLHIPFCDTICYYCGCSKIVTANRSHAAKYLNYLKKEIALKAKRIPDYAEVEQIHFGGGTPTYLDDEQLQALMLFIAEQFRFASDNFECAIEIHPQSVDGQRLEHLKNIGFNRLSLGLQDFNPEVQQAVNRFNSKQEVQALIKKARELEFNSISVDLIYGLPKQSASSFQQTLDEVIELSPDRLSLFNYAHMPHLFKSQKQINASELPEPQEKLEILHNSINQLCSNGYRYIGMDHFAKNSDALSLAQLDGSMQRNFQGYATHNNGVLHAFGLSAISSLGEHYAQNVKLLDRYYGALDAGTLPLDKGYDLNRDDLIRRDVINTLLCQFKLDFMQLKQNFGIDFHEYFSDALPALHELHSDGLIVLRDNNLEILDAGRLLARSVCKLFDQYIAKRSAADQNRYSRII